MRHHQLPESHSRFARNIRLATTTIALMIAITLPGSFYAIHYAARSAQIETEARIKANSIIQHIAANPMLWRYQEHRLSELLQREENEHQSTWTSLVDADGTEIVSAGTRPRAPALYTKAPLFDAGRPVGFIELGQSLHWLLLASGLISLFSSALGFAIYGLLQALPRRAQRLKDELFEEKERAEVTLRSISEAVLTTDINARISYLNPAAEALSGFSLEQAQGLEIHDVLNLLDENTGESTNLLARLAHGQKSDTTPLPQVVLQNKHGECIAIEVCATALQDPLGKFNGNVIIIHDVSSTRRMTKRLSWQASHDPLTGLINRREFESRIDSLLANSFNTGQAHVICYLDLDRFKQINDSYGHAAGDELLKKLSERLATHIRESDTFSRLGGDEFALLLSNCPIERGRQIASKMLEEVRNFRFAWEDQVLSVGISIGLAVINTDNSGRLDVLQKADSALYAAKHQGRNRICEFLPADSALRP